MRNALCLAVVLLGGCGVQDEMTVLEGAGDRSQDPLLIVNGSAPNQAFQASAVALHELTNGGSSVYVSPFCTGTLIRPDVVLTAAHCLDVAKGGKRNFSTMNPGDLAIYVGDDPAVDILDHLYGVVETEIYSGYSRSALLNDIALIRLAAPVTESSPIPELPASLEITSGDAGDLMNFTGFGATSASSGGGVKLQVDIPLGGVGCAVAGCFGGDPDTQISYAQGSGGPCFGDSGGPMYIDRGGQTYVAGITSYGDNNCTLYGVSTKVDAFESYIDGFAGGGSTTPTDTGTGGGTDTGTGGTDPGTCGDGVCDANESCDGRSGTDSCSSDCDGKTNGKPSGRFCWVGDTCEGSGC